MIHQGIFSYLFHRIPRCIPIHKHKKRSRFHLHSCHHFRKDLKHIHPILSKICKRKYKRKKKYSIEFFYFTIIYARFYFDYKHLLDELVSDIALHNDPSSIPVSHNSPVNPNPQTQAKESIPSSHLPPFLQGFEAHSSNSE